MPVGTRWHFRGVSALGRISKWKRSPGKELELERERESPFRVVNAKVDFTECQVRPYRALVVKSGRRDARRGRFALNRERGCVVSRSDDPLS